MTFISYAQNFEDVMLWRALKHVGRGFYVDVGAAWPDEHSVTKAFYDRDWHGINIEPNPVFHGQLHERRPKDINLLVAIGDREDTRTMNFLGNTGLSTLDDAIAQKHLRDGRSLKRRQVQVTTLAAIWRQHVPAGQAVHFLKVDVEGFEEAALRGNNWTINRPWIIVAEAMLPTLQVESCVAWEPILLASGYQFAYADGLNRFYVAEEHADLLPAFTYPPNVFDGFILSVQQQAETQAAQANERASLAETQVVEANERADTSWQQLEAVLNSRSWRFTKPLRLVGRSVKRFIFGSRVWLNFGPGSPVSQKALVWAMNKVRANSTLKARALPWIHKHPWLEKRLRSIAVAQSGMNLHMQATAQALRDTSTVSLTPRAQQIYLDIKTAIVKKNEVGA